MSHTANMIPKISVTSYHTAGSKYNNILEDTISHLQNIRESIQIVVPPATDAAYPGGKGSSCLAFGSVPACLSLPDLSGSNLTNWTTSGSATSAGLLHSRQLLHYNGGAVPHMHGCGRRRSWAAIEERHFDRAYHTKSDSVSSLDSQSQGGRVGSAVSAAAAAAAVNKRRSNSTASAITATDAGSVGGGTGGANSTHSLNDSKFFFDFERQQDKLNELSMMHCRIPLQKSISTPSIPPACEHIKGDGSTVVVSRHFSDTDEDNPDERSLICVKEKIEVDHPEKRRKRGSLFFRKKKDKSKSKASTPKHCDDCNNATGTCAEHTYEALTKGSMKQIQITKSSSKKSSDNSHSRPGDSYKDLTDGGISHHHSHGDHTMFADDANLLDYEFLNEPHLMAHHLDDDPVLGIFRETESNTWSERVGADVLKQLTAKQVKRQEPIYELIMTEKRYCQNLCLLQKVFVDSLQQHFTTINIDRLFPRLSDLIRLHKGLLKQLRLKQENNPIVDSIADILLAFFSGASGDQLKSAYGALFSKQTEAQNLFKYYENKDERFATWYKHKLNNPLLKRQDIPAMFFSLQRLTKFPLLIDEQLKVCKDNEVERTKLLHAKELVKEILNDVNETKRQKENDDRHLDIFKRIDAKSATAYRGEKFKKSDIIQFNRKLKFEGLATLMQGRSKMQTVNVIVLSDCLFFLQENNAKFQFFTPENKAGVVSLQKLIIREKATESRGIYLISSLPSLPEMFELKVQKPSEKQVWIRAIRSAVQSCPQNAGLVTGSTAGGLVLGTNGVAMTSEEQKQQQVDEDRGHTRRELVAAMRLNDLEHAILLEQKIAMQASYLRELELPLPSVGGSTADTYLSQFGSYRQLLGRDDAAATQCDTLELTRRAVNTVQEIGTLTGTLYRNATGVELPLRVASLNCGELGAAAVGVGRKGASIGGLGVGGVAGAGGLAGSSEHVTYKHPSRAETFSGFDEKMSKLISPWRDAVVSSLTHSISGGGGGNHTDSTLSVTPHSTDSQRSSTASNCSTGTGHTLTAAATTSSSSSSASQSSAQQHIAGSGASSSIASSLDTVTLRHVATGHRQPATAQDHHNALLVAHHLHALLAVVHQQMSTIAALQHELRDNSKELYRHDAKLEELRNLQDKFQEEKTVWQRQRNEQEEELSARDAKQRTLQQRMHDEQEDIREQREQLFRKMEKMEKLAAAAATVGAIAPAMLEGVGVAAGVGGCVELLGGMAAVTAAAAATAAAPASVMESVEAAHAQLQQYHQHVAAGETFIGGGSGGSGLERRSSNKERLSKTGQSFSNVPKPIIVPANVKQTLPLKLSSSRNDKTNSHSSFPTTPGNVAAGGGGGIAQMLPLKLADRKGKPSTPTASNAAASTSSSISSGTPSGNHSRTGSSPAIVQQQHTSNSNSGSAVTSPTYHHPSSTGDGRYDDRSRASRRSDTALIPTRLASMTSPATVPGRGSPAAAAAAAQLQQQQQHQLYQQQQQQKQQKQQQQPTRPSSAAASQQEEIYF